jgi:cytochrome c biogenesis protein CcmG, thiol:disulfide interchange protein DsbE
VSVVDRHAFGRVTRRHWTHALPLVLFLALAVLLALGLQRDPRAVPSALVGKPMPAFELPRLEDPRSVVTATSLQGQPWVLSVWASWCVTCRQSHPALMGWAATAQVPLVGLQHRDARPAGLAWLQRHGNPYRWTLHDPDGRLGLDLGVVAVPETYVIDARGVVRLRHAGLVTPDVIRDRLDPLLRQLTREANTPPLAHRPPGVEAHARPDAG